jgi:hypothetical protein
MTDNERKIAALWRCWRRRRQAGYASTLGPIRSAVLMTLGLAQAPRWYDYEDQIIRNRTYSRDRDRRRAWRQLDLRLARWLDGQRGEAFRGSPEYRAYIAEMFGPDCP